MVVYLKFVVAAVLGAVLLVSVWLPLIERKVPAETNKNERKRKIKIGF